MLNPQHHHRLISKRLLFSCFVLYIEFCQQLFAVGLLVEYFRQLRHSIFHLTIGVQGDRRGDPGYWFTPFSLEILPELNPDYIFLEKRTLKDYDASDSMTTLQESELWENLNAVKNNRVFPLITSDFIDGVGPICSSRLIDYVVGKLVP
ncbi:hypothetical protein ACX93W_12290 [Paenibacillus sp. CAU 1782]